MEPNVIRVVTDSTPLFWDIIKTFITSLGSGGLIAFVMWWGFRINYFKEHNHNRLDRKLALLEDFSSELATVLGEILDNFNEFNKYRKKVRNNEIDIDEELVTEFFNNMMAIPSRQIYAKIYMAGCSDLHYSVKDFFEDTSRISDCIRFVMTGREDVNNVTDEDVAYLHRKVVERYHEILGKAQKCYDSIEKPSPSNGHHRPFSCLVRLLQRR